MSPQVPAGICEGVGMRFPHATRRDSFYFSVAYKKGRIKCPASPYGHLCRLLRLLENPALSSGLAINSVPKNLRRVGPISIITTGYFSVVIYMLPTSEDIICIIKSSTRSW